MTRFTQGHTAAPASTPVAAPPPAALVVAIDAASSASSAAALAFDKALAEALAKPGRLLVARLRIGLGLASALLPPFPVARLRPSLASPPAPPRSARWRTAADDGNGSNM